MSDADEIAELHTRWVFGWERNPGDDPFDFPGTFGDLYDFAGQNVRLYDDFDPRRRVATTAAEYGANFTPAFDAMTSAHHLVESGPDVLTGTGLAASTLVFLARITTPQAVTDIRTTSSLVWRRTEVGWRIVREHNSTDVLEAGTLDGRVGSRGA
ncbi:hypothetical protein [Kineosporia succinea]|uniref:SnoaL-like protein n=1 Tax=Kineosporia succinea TaxID=84632 RepID=A0ABT9PAV1_9ACTN|nr:hypothetical protein [Kineosporia succinea]MDP9829320.1 hypothetical protein [Kineosporia succinea]